MPFKLSIRSSVESEPIVRPGDLVRQRAVGPGLPVYTSCVQRLIVDSPNVTARVTCVVGGMLAGADSIDEPRPAEPSGIRLGDQVGRSSSLRILRQMSQVVFPTTGTKQPLEVGAAVRFWRARPTRC